jgi:hypothetical protein
MSCEELLNQLKNEGNKVEFNSEVNIINRKRKKNYIILELLKNNKLKYNRK